MAKKKSISRRAPLTSEKLPVLLTPKFTSFYDVAQWSKKAVYLIARMRPIDNKGGYEAVSLGTGFLAARSRFITCAHVINNIETDIAIRHHKDGDLYVLVQRDEDGAEHRAIMPLLLNKDLFVFPDIDLAIIHLPKGFYTDDELHFYKHPDQRIRVSVSSRGVGRGVGVLGYPLQHIQSGKDGDVDTSGVMIRADQGIVNIRYTDPVEKYEFTMAFNSGNSGGPIVDAKSGHAIAIVHGFRSSVANFQSVLLDEEQQKKFQTDKALIPVTATYSIGIGTKNFIEILKQHQIDYAD